MSEVPLHHLETWAMLLRREHSPGALQEVEIESIRKMLARVADQGRRD